MFDYIEKLRSKPERTKKLVAAGSSFLFVAVILFFWFFSVFPQFRQEKEISDRVQSVEPSPISALSQILSQGTGGIGGALAKIKSLGSVFTGTEVIDNTAASYLASVTPAEASGTSDVSATTTLTQ